MISRFFSKKPFLKLFPAFVLGFGTCIQAAEPALSSASGETGPIVVNAGFPASYYNPAAFKEVPTVSFWLETSLNRVFPASKPGNRTLTQITARNARCSFQACLRNDRSWPIEAQCAVSADKDLKITVRRVGYVPQWNFTADVPQCELDGWGHVPGLVPDPLYPEPKALVGPYGAQSFWITIEVSADARPGIRKLPVTFTSGALKEPVTLTAELEISPVVLQPRQNFPVTHWWNADAIYDWHKLPVFGEQWWEITPAYLKNMLDHGSDVILVPIFYMRREIVERPSQLLIINEPAPGKYEFDWSRVKRFVDMAKKAGFNKFEWSHFWQYKVDPSTTSVDTPQRLYKWVDGKPQLLWPKNTEATGPIFRNFLTQFLPEFEAFLNREGVLQSSFFHLSDEPGGDPKDLEAYRKARELLKELAPWMKVMDAMSDIRYGREKGLTDIPVPAVHAAQGYIDEKIPHWVYYCTGPRGAYLNRFFDTSLSKIRMSGWLFHRLGARGFLHWGYNYWYVMDLSFNERTQVLVDPFTDGAAGTTAGGAGEPYGDSFVVYPGAKGPIDSIRWEVFAESLQDYALLQTCGIKPNDPMLSELKTYSEFPKNEKWIKDALDRLLKPWNESK
jgi:hypothetical protein